ncbi:hypothetical protein B5M09_011338 [Aphanomyces astaci]|uniref:Uncharacterized protein n=1 Tax=Aphanomyces astaci TaxID=112090 RepID=A0A3R7ZJS3_APHAT|nr:hypothetical protein B5M09_011338 [Aphanomyces astaci]
MGFAPLASTTLTNGTVEDHSAAATYIVSLGLSFPCDFGAFKPVTLSSPIPPLDGIWQVNLVSTNESVHFACTTGKYRRSPDIQGSYNYYYWSLPSNVVAFAANLDFNDVHRWTRSFGSPTFTRPSNDALAFASCCHWSTVYSIGRWYPFQWAVNQATDQSGLGGTMYFNDNARADTLWCCLAASHALATCLHVRIHLFVVVVIFVVCDYFRLEIVNYTGMYLDHVNAFATSNYLDNIIAQPTKVTMNVWAFHENVTTDYKLILNEYTYLWVAAGLCQVYVVLEKVARTLAATPTDDYGQQTLVAINDYAYIVVNAVIGTLWFTVCGFPIDDMMILGKVQLHPHHIHRIWRVSLKCLH